MIEAPETGAAVEREAPAKPKPVFTRDAVLERDELADALGVNKRTIENVNVPCSYALGPRNPRYIWGDVLDWLRKKANG